MSSSSHFLPRIGVQGAAVGKTYPAHVSTRGYLPYHLPSIHPPHAVSADSSVAAPVSEEEELEALKQRLRNTGQQLQKREREVRDAEATRRRAREETENRRQRERDAEAARLQREADERAVQERRQRVIEGDNTELNAFTEEEQLELLIEQRLKRMNKKVPQPPQQQKEAAAAEDGEETEEIAANEDSTTPPSSVRQIVHRAPAPPSVPRSESEGSTASRPRPPASRPAAGATPPSGHRPTPPAPRTQNVVAPPRSTFTGTREQSSPPSGVDAARSAARRRLQAPAASNVATAVRQVAVPCFPRTPTDPAAHYGGLGGRMADVVALPSMTDVMQGEAPRPASSGSGTTAATESTEYTDASTLGATSSAPSVRVAREDEGIALLFEAAAENAKIEQDMQIQFSSLGLILNEPTFSHLHALDYLRVATVQPWLGLGLLGFTPVTQAATLLNEYVAASRNRRASRAPPAEDFEGLTRGSSSALFKPGFVRPERRVSIKEGMDEATYIPGQLEAETDGHRPLRSPTPPSLPTTPLLEEPVVTPLELLESASSSAHPLIGLDLLREAGTSKSAAKASWTDCVCSIAPPRSSVAYVLQLARAVGDSGYYPALEGLVVASAALERPEFGGLRLMFHLCNMDGIGDLPGLDLLRSIIQFAL